MKLAILVREETMERCTGKGCLNAFFHKKDSFARYADIPLELMGFTHASGDLDKKIETLRKNGVDTIHVSSCLRSKSPDYDAIIKRLQEYFTVVGYTHGSAERKTTS